MKNVLIMALAIIAMASCGDVNSDKATTGINSDTSATLITPAADSTATGKGTDKIPSRTGATGQGNTTVTGSATGSPTGVKDSTK